MNRDKLIFCTKLTIIALACCPLLMRAEEEQHWQYIRDNYVKAQTEEQWEKGLSYIRSLTLQEMLVAGRQCGQEIEENEDRQWWPRASMGFIFFNDFYKLKNDFSFSDFEVLLSEIKNENHSVVWRGQVAECLLSDLVKRLNTEKIFEILPEFEELLLSPKIDSYIKEQILTDYPVLLKYLRQSLDKEKELNDFYQEKISERARILIRTNLDLLKPKNTTGINNKIITSLLRCQQYNLPGCEYIKREFSKTMTELDKFPKELHESLKDAAKSFCVEKDEIVPK